LGGKGHVNVKESYHAPLDPLVTQGKIKEAAVQRAMQEFWSNQSGSKGGVCRETSEILPPIPQTRE